MCTGVVVVDIDRLVFMREEWSSCLVLLLHQDWSVGRKRIRREKHFTIRERVVINRKKKMQTR